MAVTQSSVGFCPTGKDRPLPFHCTKPYPLERFTLSFDRPRGSCRNLICSPGSFTTDDFTLWCLGGVHSRREVPGMFIAGTSVYKVNSVYVTDVSIDAEEIPVIRR